MEDDYDSDNAPIVEDSCLFIFPFPMKTLKRSVKVSDNFNDTN